MKNATYEESVQRALANITAATKPHPIYSAPRKRALDIMTEFRAELFGNTKQTNKLGVWEMEFKQAITLLKQAEKKARLAQSKLDAAHIQFDNAREVISHKYNQEWKAYCAENSFAPNYAFGDILC